MIEKLYNEMISVVRNFTNSINRNNSNDRQNIELFLNEIISMAKFLNRDDDDSKILEDKLIKELRKFSKKIFVKTNNKNIYLSKMQKNIDFITWINKSIDINKKVYKIYCCPT